MKTKIILLVLCIFFLGASQSHNAGQLLWNGEAGVYSNGKYDFKISGVFPGFLSVNDDVEVSGIIEAQGKSGLTGVYDIGEDSVTISGGIITAIGASDDACGGCGNICEDNEVSEYATLKTGGECVIINNFAVCLYPAISICPYGCNNDNTGCIDRSSCTQGLFCDGPGDNILHSHMGWNPDGSCRYLQMECPFGCDVENYDGCRPQCFDEGGGFQCITSSGDLLT